jgi:hypothetical protein
MNFILVTYDKGFCKRKKAWDIGRCSAEALNAANQAAEFLFRYSNQRVETHSPNSWLILLSYPIVK